MVFTPFALREDYWSTFTLQEEDIEFLYNYLLELETPLTTDELTASLVNQRIEKEKANLEKQRSSKGEIYFPKENYETGQSLLFPALNWRYGTVAGVRPGRNPELGDFSVVEVQFDNGEKREFASRLADHLLNQPPDLTQTDDSLNTMEVLSRYQEDLSNRVEEGLESNQDFVRIAGRWFPRTLLVDINTGHLNLAEAVLDMAGGGPLPTSALLEQIEIPTTTNRKLVEFSFDLALQEDGRFDEVGPAGQVLWYLRRLEPPEVLETPPHLRYSEMEYDRSLLTPAMQALERELDDELSPIGGKGTQDEVSIRLIFPHWRSGTLPLSSRIRHLFPTAYETPRIRFMLVDGDSGEKFPGWIVRQKRYVYGLQEWYKSRSLFPGSLVWVKKGQNPGEVIVHSDNRRPSRDWVRTLLIGSDGGMVFAMLKQVIAAAYDDRMVIAIPDLEAVDQAWQKIQKDRVPFERLVVNTVRELAKLNPQSHVHASELYAAVNVMRRCPPGPLLALLAGRSWFVHVGDLHFRFDDSEHE